jgi:SAM-dependent methyltransferase
MTVAAYDAHADWYEDFVAHGVDYMDRIRATLADLLGRGSGLCLDLCCGTGAHAATIRGLGWTPVGVDLSGGQLRHAAGRLPAALGDVVALPVRSGSLPAVACVLAHTDVPDYAAALRESARVLRPGGRFVHVGLHPCFVGGHADRADEQRVVVTPRYLERARTFDSWTPHGVRVRVGAWQLTVADLVNAVIDAGLRIERVVEAGPDRGVPGELALAATKP